MELEDAASRRRLRFQNFLKSHPPIGSHVNVFSVYVPFDLHLCEVLRFLSCVRLLNLTPMVLCCISPSAFYFSTQHHFKDPCVYMSVHLIRCL